MVTYDGLKMAASAEEAHLGGNIKGGDPMTYSPKVWDYLIERFALSSIMDLGSGQGYAANYFFKRGIRVVAIEGFVENVQSSVYPSIVHDLTKGPIITRVDLVHCQEVVEHIEEQFVGNIINTLTCGKFIVFTHAIPGQGGYHHVNLQESAYWIAHMEAKGCTYLAEDSNRIKSFAKEDGALFLERTGMIFSNDARI